MIAWLKSLRVPDPEQSVDLAAVKTWEVRWEGRHGNFSFDVSPQLEVFTSKEDAIIFAESLRAAFKLIRHVGANSITVTERK